MPTTLARTGREIIEAHLKQRVRAIPLAVPRDAPTQFAFPSTGLVSYWSMDSNFQDQVGTNHLTNVNGVTSVAGKLGNAGDFESSSSQYLACASNASLQTGDIDFTFALWVKPETLDGYPIILGKDGTEREYTLYYRSTAWTFSIGYDILSPLLPAVIGEWQFIVGWHDAALNTVNIQVNNGTTASSSTGGTAVPVGSTEFRIGARVYAGFEGYFDGSIDEVGLWRRVLTAQERSDLWNGGAGLTLPVAPPVFPSTGLVSYWTLDETSGTRVDSVGTNHLTPTNAPGSAAGKIGNGCDFESTASQYLSHPDPTPLGDEDFTYSLWFKRETFGVQQILLGKDDDTGRSFFVSLESGQLRFVNEGIGTFVNCPVSVNDTSWHFVICGYDATANLLFLQLDDGTVTSASSGPIVPNAIHVRIGAREYPGFEWYFDGLIDEVGLWRRVLTAQERSDLWNGGAGLPQSGLHAQDIVLTDDPRDQFAAYVVQVETGAMPFRVRVDPPTVFHPGYYYEHVSEDGEGLWVYAPTR